MTTILLDFSYFNLSCLIKIEQKDSSMKKILFCDNSLKSFINFRIDILHHFILFGWKTFVVVPNSTIKDEHVKILPKETELIGINMNPNGSNPFSDIIALCSLVACYRKVHPNVVINYTIKPNIYSSIAAKFCGIRCISIVAGLGYIFTDNGLSKRIARTLYKFGLRLSDKVFVLNEANKSLLINKGFVKKENLVHLPAGEGVNLNTFPYIRNKFEATRFLMVARVLYDKGYSEYVEAASIVREKYPDIECELLGPLASDSPMGVPEGIVRRDHNDGKIKYLGVTNDVPQYLGRDGVVVVCSSYHEGLNRSLMEACAMGRPCITSNIPGCREAVDDGVNGYLVPSKDARALADVMLKFIELPVNEKQRMAEASYKKAKNTFDVGQVFDYYDKALSEIHV